MSSHAADRPASASSPPKRRRISRACLQCRTRKIKCNGQEPACDNCVASAQTCVYTESKRRGLPPGYVMHLEMYLKALEILLGFALITLPDVAASFDTILAKFGAFHGSTPGSPAALAFDHDFACHEQYRAKWKDSQTHKNIQTFASSLPIVPGLPPHAHASGAQGSTSSLGTLVVSQSAQSTPSPTIQPQQLSRSLSKLNPATSAPAQPSFPSTTVAISPYKQRYGPTSSFPDLTLGSPRTLIVSHATTPRLATSEWIHSIPLNRKLALINNYVENEHSWLPMLNPQVLIRLAGTTSPQSQKAETREIGQGELALLAAVLSTQSSVETTIPETSTRTAQTGSPTFLQVVTDITSSPFPLGIPGKPSQKVQPPSHSSQLALVQAHLIFTLGLVAQDLLEDAWSVCGLAVRSAYALGINVFDHSKGTKETWYAICIIDTLVASAFGRTPHVCHEDFDLTPRDDSTISRSDGSSPENNTFHALFSLTRILNHTVRWKNSRKEPQTPASASDASRRRKSIIESFIPNWIKKYGTLIPGTKTLVDSTSDTSPQIFNLRLTFVIIFCFLGDTFYLCQPHLKTESLEDYVASEIYQFAQLVGAASPAALVPHATPFLTYLLRTIVHDGVDDVDASLSNIAPTEYQAVNDIYYSPEKKYNVLSKRLSCLQQIMPYYAATVSAYPSDLEDGVRPAYKLLQQEKKTLGIIETKVARLEKFLEKEKMREATASTSQQIEQQQELITQVNKVEKQAAVSRPSQNQTSHASDMSFFYNGLDNRIDPRPNVLSNSKTTVLSKQALQDENISPFSIMQINTNNTSDTKFREEQQEDLLSSSFVPIFAQQQHYTQGDQFGATQNQRQRRQSSTQQILAGVFPQSSQQQEGQQRPFQFTPQPLPMETTLTQQLDATLGIATGRGDQICSLAQTPQQEQQRQQLLQFAQGLSQAAAVTGIPLPKVTPMSDISVGTMGIIGASTSLDAVLGHAVQMATVPTMDGIAAMEPVPEFLQNLGVFTDQ